MSYYDAVAEAAAWVRGHMQATPEVAVVLGSGLGAFADGVGGARQFAYGEIPHWPCSAVVGHAGRLVLGRVQGRDVAVLAGRAHFYEGHDLRTATFAIRVLGLLGVKILILTNAAGGVNTSFAQGVLMVIDDHINLIGSNPLIGPNEDRFGPRFPDMSEVYSRRLRRLADAAAADRPVCPSPTGSTRRCMARAMRRRRKSGSCARSARMPWACRLCPRRSSPATWA